MGYNYAINVRDVVESGAVLTRGGIIKAEPPVEAGCLEAGGGEQAAGGARVARPAGAGAARLSQQRQATTTVVTGDPGANTVGRGSVRESCPVVAWDKQTLSYVFTRGGGHIKLSTLISPLQAIRT